MKAVTIEQQQQKLSTPPQTPLQNRQLELQSYYSENTTATPTKNNTNNDNLQKSTSEHDTVLRGSSGSRTASLLSPRLQSGTSTPAEGSWGVPDPLLHFAQVISLSWIWHNDQYLF